jgi:hypothetical protein
MAIVRRSAPWVPWSPRERRALLAGLAHGEGRAGAYDAYGKIATED